MTCQPIVGPHIPIKSPDYTMRVAQGHAPLPKQPPRVTQGQRTRETIDYLVRMIEMGHTDDCPESPNSCECSYYAYIEIWEMLTGERWPDDSTDE